jgi:hypothetical protein
MVDWSQFDAEGLFQWAIDREDVRSYSFWLRRAADAGHQVAIELLSDCPTQWTRRTEVISRYLFNKGGGIPTDEEIQLCSPYLFFERALYAPDDSKEELLWWERGAEAGCLRCLSEIWRFNHDHPLVLHTQEYYDGLGKCGHFHELDKPNTQKW